MQPNQPVSEPQHSANPYDFILETGSGPTPDSPEAKSRRTVIVVAGGAILMVVLGIFAAILLGGSKDSGLPVVSLVQQQTEIARIAELGNNKTKSPSTRRLVATVRLTALSNQQELVANLAKNGIKVKEQDLALKKDPKIDETLTAAEQNNRFDETIVQILRTKLDSYLVSARAAIGTSKSNAQIDLLKSSIADVEMLLTLNAP